MNTQEELFRMSAIRFGIVINMAKEARSALNNLGAIIEQGRPKGLKKVIWEDLLLKHKELKEILGQ